MGNKANHDAVLPIFGRLGPEVQTGDIFASGRLLTFIAACRFRDTALIVSGAQPR